MSRLILDHKAVSSPDAYALAKFVHELTLKGYEPLPLQCNRQYGNIVITMALYEGEKSESVEESTDSKLGTETTDPVGSTNGSVETEESSENEGEEESGEKSEGSNGSTDTGTANEGQDSNVGAEPTGDTDTTSNKSKRNTRAKAKTE